MARSILLALFALAAAGCDSGVSTNVTPAGLGGDWERSTTSSTVETVSYFVLRNGYHYELESGGVLRERGKFAVAGDNLFDGAAESFEIQHYPFPEESGGAPWRFETARLTNDVLVLTSELGESREYRRAQ